MDSNRDTPTHNDLSALAWVQEELRKSLEASNKALHRFLAEAQGAAGSDVDDVEPAILRSARQQLHQSAGALELVGLTSAAHLLRAAEAAVQRFVLKPHKLDRAAVDALEQASFGLLDYLSRLLAGRRISAVSLFPQYRALQKLAGAERAHPADLWSFDWRWIELPAEAGVAPRAPDAAARAEMEKLLLLLMRQPASLPAITARMSELCASLGVQPATLQARSFWRLAAAFFQGQAQGLMPSDVYTKRVASSVLAQLGMLGRGEADVSDRLAQDLLFFCAQCNPPQPEQAPRLVAVRRAYGLERIVPVNYEESHLGRFDPALVLQARKRVAGAKDSWSAVAGGEMHRLHSLGEQFQLVGDSLRRIYPGGEALADALQHAVVQTVNAKGHLEAPLAMEVATSVLYLEASLEDGDFDEPALVSRTARLAQRIEAVRQGRAPDPLEPWMEELYRRVSDRQTMGSVVQELRASLSDAEEHIDQFFRKPEDTSVLVPVPAQLGAMRGVLSVLGMKQASQAVLRMRDDIDAMIAGTQGQAGVSQDEQFNRLAGNLGALGFLIDMLNVQPTLAKSLFVFDESSGELRPVMGRAMAVEPLAALQEAPAAPRPEESAPLQVSAAAFEPSVPELPVPELPAPKLSVAELPVPELPAPELPVPQVPVAPVAEEPPAVAPVVAGAAELPALEFPLDLPVPAPQQAPASPAPVAGPAEPILPAFEFDLNLPEPASSPAPVAQAGQPAPASVLAEAPVAAPKVEPVASSVPAPVAPVAAPAPVVAAAVPAAAPPARPVAAAPVPAVPLPAPLVDDEVDPEMREIFLEEAAEVVLQAGEGLDQMSNHRSDADPMTVVRRAFHTLKGSARMVGLKDFGEAGWACEQLYNVWLAEQRPASKELLALSREVLAYMSAWVQEIASGTQPTHQSPPVRLAADALRLEGRHVPLASVAVAPGLPEAEKAAALPAAAPALPSAAAELPAAVVQAVPAVAVPAAAAPVATPEPDVPAFTLPAAAEPDAVVFQETERPALPESEPALDFSLDFLVEPASPVAAEVASATAAAVPEAPELFEPAADVPTDVVAGLGTFDAPLLPAVEFAMDSTPAGEAPGLSVDVAPPLPDAQPVEFDAAFTLDPAAPEAAGLTLSREEALPEVSAESLDVGDADFDLLFGTPAASEEPTPAGFPPSEETGAAAPGAEEQASTPLQWDGLAEEPTGAVPAAGIEAAIDFELDVPALEDDRLAPADSLRPDLEPFPAPIAPTPAFEAAPLASAVPEADLPQGPQTSAASVEQAVVPAPVPELAAPVLPLQAVEPDMPAALQERGEETAAEPLVQPLDATAADAPAQRADAWDASRTDELVKVIGPLRVATPLFNIYLAEADELSRRLCAELGEWAAQPRQQMSELAVAAAHSLAGCSATVGFSDLSQLARQLEHALIRTQAIGDGGAREASLFSEVAEEIRRLLHQFAAGFLRTPQPQLLERLAAHDVESAQRLREVNAGPGQAEANETDYGPLVELALDAEGVAEPDTAPANVPVQPEPASSAVLPDAVIPVADFPAQAAEPTFGEEASVPAEEPVLPELVLPAPELPQPSVLSSEEVLPEPVTPPVAEAAPAAPAVPAAVPEVQLADLMRPGVSALESLEPLAPAAPRSETAVRAHDIDDDIDAVDAVDPDLFPIFEEEAEELLPKLAGEMREWLQQPDERAAANACMRTLHTLKGGARLAGAMRLGELAHRLETIIERLMSRGDIVEADVEPLQSKVDALSATFEALRSMDEQAYAEAAAAALQPAPLPPVSVAVATPDASAEAGASDPAAEPAESAEALELVRQALLPIDWSRFTAGAGALRSAPARAAGGGNQTSVRVRAQLLDRLVGQAGEVSITRARLEAELGNLRSSVGDLTDNLERLRQQLRDIELQAETQMSTRMEAAKAEGHQFDPLEFDRFTRFQEITRMMAESVNDVHTVQRTLQRTLQTAEDELAAQARLTRDLQDDLLRTRMVEFEGLFERLYRVVRQAAKESGKQVRLDIVGGSIEVDRGVLERMTSSFEHLLRNSVTHGIELPEQRVAAGKDPIGTILVSVQQEGNEVTVELRDDGAGLNLERIRAKAIASGKIAADAQLSDEEIASLIFLPGLTTAETITELAGRGVGMDVVRSEVNAMGGRIETATAAGQGTRIRLVLPLTTAVTQVVMLRCGETVVGVPASLIEIVRRGTLAEVAQGHETGVYAFADQALPFFWLGALLQSSGHSSEPPVRSVPVVIVRSASQRVALHVDEVLGHQEVVVKNLGPQLSRLPGLAGMTLLASGAVGLIYNPVALATVYGKAARTLTTQAQLAAVQPTLPSARDVAEAEATVPLVLVVDDSLTVRRVTQRLLVREGYRVTLAKDGLDALERLAEERPTVVLSDIEMPRMDGFDLVRNMRADAALAGLPVIMITSRIAQKHRDYAVELGVDHYLGKPYNEEELLGLIAEYCRAAQPA